MLPYAQESQVKINSDLSVRNPWVTFTFGHSPLLDLRAVSGVKHDVQVSVPCHSIAHSCQRKICRVRLLERHDLGRVI